MSERALGRWMLILGCVLLTSCGSSVAIQRSVLARPNGPRQSARNRCAKAANLSAKVSLAGWHLGVVEFSSATSGVGITAESFPCFRRVKIGTQVGTQRQLVRLALTSDGGRAWHVTGASLPVGSVADGVAAEQIAATGPGEIWAVVGRGHLLATHDNGSDWQVQAVPTPVVDLTVADGSVWAVSCPGVRPGTARRGCHPQLWRSGSPNDAWTRVGLPRVTALDPYDVLFAAAANDMIVGLLPVGPRPVTELLTSRNTGRRWTARRAPTWAHNPCTLDAALTAHQPSTFWLLCLGNAAAGSSTKGLLRSTNAGRTWTTVSAVTSLTQAPTPGSISSGEPSALAAGSRTRLWLSLTNGLAESDNGGRRWTNGGVINPGGWTIALDPINASHAWALAAGAGLWRTTDGLHWHPVGPQNNN
jgi:photosystem II stability/assembly factor-like uncharacterized protein